MNKDLEKIIVSYSNKIIQYIDKIDSKNNKLNHNIEIKSIESLDNEDRYLIKYKITTNDKSRSNVSIYLNKNKLVNKMQDKLLDIFDQNNIYADNIYLVYLDTKLYNNGISVELELEYENNTTFNSNVETNSNIDETKINETKIDENNIIQIISRLNYKINNTSTQYMNMVTNQDFDYEISLYTDLVKSYNKYISDIEIKRNESRNNFMQLAQEIEDIDNLDLTDMEKKILRIPLRYRNKQDNTLISEINEKIKRSENTCINEIQETQNVSIPVYKFKLDNINKTLCADLDKIYDIGSYNIELKYVDIPITINNKEYILSVDKETSSNIINTLTNMYGDIRKGILYLEAYDYKNDLIKIESELENMTTQ